MTIQPNEHVCWIDDTTCALCGSDIGQHLAGCECRECAEENENEAADALGY
jgi:hypothetical protein